MKSWFLGEGTGKDIGEVVYTLRYLKWITNKNLLYSTQNSAQHYVPVWMGGRYWRRIDICIYMAEESLHCSLETITTLLISYTSIQNRRRQWQPTPVLLSGESQGQGILVGCHLWGHVRICATLWTAAHQAPPSIGVSRQEYWSGLPFPSPQQSTNGNNYTANTYHYVLGTVFSHLLFHVLLTALCHIIL